MPTPPEEIVSALFKDFEELPELRTAPMRELRRKYSKKLRSRGADDVFLVSQLILDSGKHRWIAYELIRYHPSAFQALDRQTLEVLGSGINSWSSVDSFARTLSGPAWREGLISIDTIEDWAQSNDRWWRRAALVSTVALNVRSRGGKGDVQSTLAICEMLVEDRDDMVVKALSWALRALVDHDPTAIDEFIRSYDAMLAARVKREVRNKLETGLKYP